MVDSGCGSRWKAFYQARGCVASENAKIEYRRGVQRIYRPNTAPVLELHLFVLRITNATPAAVTSRPAMAGHRNDSPNSA